MRRLWRAFAAWWGVVVVASAVASAPDDGAGDGVPPGCILIDDIILPADFFTNRATFGAGARPWDRHVVYFVFHESVSGTNRTRTLNAMAAIESVCSLVFIEDVHEDGYLQIRDWNTNSSYIGKTGAYAQVINIVSWSYQFIIVHELLHALGMWHEQQRPDRGQYVQINDANIQAGKAGNFDLISSADTFGAYDFDSLMHYDACSFSTCCPAGSTCSCPSGCETITALPPYQAFQELMGQRSHLSAGDIAWLVYVYGEPDCNGNGVPDYDDIQSGFSEDCNGNGVPDSCDLASGVPTYSDQFHGFASYADCNGNGTLDSCDMDAGAGTDCNANGVLDECDIATGVSQDADSNGEPDECTPAPGPFALLSPANGSSGVPTGLSMDWTDSSGAGAYLVEIDTGPTFASPPVAESVGSSTLTLAPGTLSASTTYFWRVTAMNVGGAVVSSPSISAFTTGAAPPGCAGDISGDGDVDVFDFSILSTYFGTSGHTPGTSGDLDGDGDVDIFDFGIFATDYGCTD